MAKIAVELERAIARRAEQGAPGEAVARLLARGDGWAVSDVVCTSGPQDRPFEERHANVRIAVVLAGSFHYRSTAGGGLMTPGSLLLGNTGETFECGHQHGCGDRCVSFQYEPEYFERIAADIGAAGRLEFALPRLPPLRGLSPLVARTCAGIARRLAADAAGETPWDELAIRLAARTVQLVRQTPGIDPDASAPPPLAIARVTEVVRAIEHHLDDSSAPPPGLDLGSLARAVGSSPYHFLRTFERVTGVTPHQYILRTRLRAAATRLALEPARVLDIALDCGFGDVSNFNRSFRAEFGVNPRGYRQQAGNSSARAR